MQNQYPGGVRGRKRRGGVLRKAFKAHCTRTLGPGPGGDLVLLESRCSFHDERKAQNVARSTFCLNRCTTLSVCILTIHLNMTPCCDYSRSRSCSPVSRRAVKRRHKAPIVSADCVCECVLCCAPGVITSCRAVST